MYIHYDLNTYHKIADDNGSQEERNAGDIAHVHAVPHGLNPLAAEHSEHDHKAVHKVCEVPARQITIRKTIFVIYSRAQWWEETINNKYI